MGPRFSSGKLFGAQLLASVLAIAGPGLRADGQAGAPAAQGSSVLQQRYDKAQQFQAAQNLPAAAEQYRIFLADALGEIAIGLAQAHQYDKAADDFDEALRLVPEFPMMRLQYARASLQAGNLDRAKTQAERILAERTANQQAAAGAHEVLGRTLLRSDKDAEAKKELEQAVAMDSSFDNGYELAVADIDLGDAKGAATLFAEMVKAYGDQAALHMYFGRAFAGSDFQAESMAEFQKALAMDPQLPGLHYCLAAAWLAGGDAHLAEAEAELRKEIAITPSDAAAYAALGHLLAGQANDPAHAQEAEQNLRQAIKLDPQNPDAFLFLGQLLAQQSKPEEAIVNLRQSITLTSDPAHNAYQVQKAHYLLGRLLIKAGQTQQGQAELAISEDLMHRNLRRDQKRLSEYLRDEDDPRSVSGSFDPALASHAPAHVAADIARVQALEARLTPAIADSYNNLGAIAANQNQFRAAVLAFQRAAEWDPKLPGLDFNWGRAAFAAGMTAEATGPLRRYLKAHPEDEGARTVLGLSLYRNRDCGEARTVLLPLQGKTEAPVQVRFAYADCLVDGGDVRNGVAQLEALAKTNPDVGEIHDALGRAFVSSQLPRAAQEYETALKLNPDDAAAHAGVAAVELKRGDTAEAVTHLKRAVALQPDDAALRQQLAEASRKVNDQH